MQTIILKKTMIAGSLFIALAVPAAFATNGLVPAGLGQEHKAMGGAAAGNPINTMSMATNPAAASFIDDGWDVELELFKPNRTITRKALPPEMGGVASETFTADEKSVFAIPGGGYKRQYNEKYAVGVSVYGNGGMNTEFGNGPTMISDGRDGFPVAGTVVPFSQSGENSGVNFEQLFIAPTLGIKLNENNSLGISANVVYQRFKAQGLETLAGFSGNPTKFTGNGTDSASGIGATIGWMGKLSNATTAGASYRFKTNMGKFKKYAGLLPDGGKMDVPAALTVGMSHKVSPTTNVAVDVQQVYYSKVGAVGNSGQTPLPFGADGGPGFGWDDQTIIKVGIKHQLNNKLALMAGYNHGKSPADSDDTFFNSLTPAVVEDHMSLGFEYKLDKKAALNGNYTHTFSNEVEGSFAAGQPFDLKMSQDAIGIGYSVKF